MNYRVYFHKPNGDDPVVWSFDQGDQTSEIHIQWFSLVGICAQSRSKLDAQPGEPSGWLQIDGAAIELAHGGVIFTPAVRNG